MQTLKNLIKNTEFNQFLIKKLIKNESKNYEKKFKPEKLI